MVDDRQRDLSELKHVNAAIAAVEPVELSRRFWVLLFACHMVSQQILQAQLALPGAFTAERDRHARMLRTMAVGVEATDLGAMVEQCARDEADAIARFRKWLAAQCDSEDEE